MAKLALKKTWHCCWKCMSCDKETPCSKNILKTAELMACKKAMSLKLRNTGKTRVGLCNCCPSAYPLHQLVIS